MAIYITDIYRRVNLPTVLILPVFAHQICKIPIRRRKAPPVPLYMLLWEYGLENAYIELDPKSVVPQPIGMVVKFTEEVLQNKQLTASEFHSLNDRLVSNRYVEVWRQDEFVFYRMAMAENILKDVIKIIESKYTQVSDFYQKAITTAVPRLPNWRQNPGHYIMAHNIPLAILKNHQTLRDLIEEDLGVKVSSDLFRKFDLKLDVYMP